MRLRRVPAAALKNVGAPKYRLLIESHLHIESFKLHLESWFRGADARASLDSRMSFPRRAGGRAGGPSLGPVWEYLDLLLAHRKQAFERRLTDDFRIPPTYTLAATSLSPRFFLVSTSLT